jgi:O-antigen ligase
LAVLLTASRGGFSGAVVAGLGSAVLLLVWRRREAGLVLAGMVATAGVLWMLVPGESLARLATIPEQVGEGDLNDRLTIWIAGFHAFSMAPWFGYGAGTYAAAAKLAAGDTAHNTGMAVLVTGGLIGLGVLVAVVAATGVAVARTSGLLRIGLATVLAVWGLTAMVGSVEENRATWLLFALMGVAGRLAVERREELALVFSGIEAARVEWRAYALR